MRKIPALPVFLVVSCFLAWGQTSIEYGTASTGTAMTASKTGGVAAKSIREVGKRLSDAIESPSSTSAPAQQVSTSTDTSMRSNRQLLERQAQQRGCAMLHISSVPEKATLYVNQLMVAATPADLCLPTGKQILELKSPGFRAWHQEITLSSGETLSLAPKLSEAKQTQNDKRIINLPF